MQRYSNMSNYTVIRSNDHLAHYGVLGMKWGVRKSVTSTGNFLYKHRPKKLWEKSTKRASISNAKRTIKRAKKKQRKMYNSVMNKKMIELGDDLYEKYPEPSEFMDAVFEATSSIKEYRDLEDLIVKSQRYLDKHAK